MHPLPASAQPLPNPQGIVGAIPARYGSTRLPGKPLWPIAGRPMIEHVYRRAEQASGLDRVVVLTDDERIARAVEGFGGAVRDDARRLRQRHRPHRLGGAALGRRGAVINIQGDEPLIDPDGISARGRATSPRTPTIRSSTLAAAAEPGDLEDPERGQGGARSRAATRSISAAPPIPYPRQRRRRRAAAAPRHLRLPARGAAAAGGARADAARDAASRSSSCGRSRTASRSGCSTGAPAVLGRRHRGGRRSASSGS